MRNSTRGAQTADHRVDYPFGLMAVFLQGRVEIDSSSLSTRANDQAWIERGAGASMLDFDCLRDGPIAIRQFLESAAGSLAGLCMRSRRCERQQRGCD